MIEIDGQLTTHQKTTPEKFNNYYVSVADNITNNNPINNTIDDLTFWHRSFTFNSNKSPT